MVGRRLRGIGCIGARVRVGSSRHRWRHSRRDVTSYDDNVVVNGTAYYFQVAAVNAVGETRSLEVSAMPAVVGWTPASLVPTAWFDASNAGSITTVGTAGHVSQWNDLSGHGYHVTQATDAARPVTGVATVNARNVVRFTGAQTITRAGVAHPQPFAVYFVGTFRAASASYEAMFDLGTNPTPGPQVGTNPANALYAYAGIDGVASTGDLNVVHSYVVVFNTTTSSIYRDGVLLATFNGGAQSVTGIRLGGTWDGNRADIDLAELVIGDAPANPTAWFDYTTTKWGTPNTAATAPAAPVLTATAGNATVHLSWTVPANGGSPITAYRVYRGTSPGGELAAPFASLASTATTYDDNTVTNATTYYYQVAAVNAIGETRSTEKNATPQATATAPGAPVLTATGGNATVHLSWTVPANGGSPITAYRCIGARAPAASSRHRSRHRWRAQHHLRRQHGHERHDLLLPSRRGQRDRRNPLDRKERDTASHRDRAGSAGADRDRGERDGAFVVDGARKWWVADHGLSGVSGHEPGWRARGTVRVTRGGTDKLRRQHGHERHDLLLPSRGGQRDRRNPLHRKERDTASRGDCAGCAGGDCDRGERDGASVVDGAGGWWVADHGLSGVSGHECGWGARGTVGVTRGGTRRVMTTTRW